MSDQSEKKPPADEGPVERPVVRPDFLAQIEACKRSVAAWPAWMKQAAQAPLWMGVQGWDD